jgi:sugar phosphate isomerase/epimerase
MSQTISRRAFLERASAGAALAVASPDLKVQGSTTQGAPSPGRWKLIAFSKPFTALNFSDTADLVAEVGWDGIECPVRRTNTHIAPERVEDDLPKMVEALKTRGRVVSLITTDIVGVDATAERILRTAAKLGIRIYRLGPIRYAANRPIPDQIADFKARFRDLAHLNQSLGIEGAIQNHSGQDYFAAPVWDAVQAIQGIGRGLGIGFDIGHATLEGGLSWPLQARLAEPAYTLVYVKDFRWEKQARGWVPVWCPLGEGMVNRKFFATLALSKYAGPICQHHEYDLGRTLAENKVHYKRDLQVLRDWVNTAGA